MRVSKPFAAILLLAILVAVYSIDYLWTKRGEEQAARTVEELGGRVTRDEEQPHKPVIAVDLSSTQATDADLQILAKAFVQRPAGIHQEIIHPRAARFGTESAPAVFLRV